MLVLLCFLWYLKLCKNLLFRHYSLFVQNGSIQCLKSKDNKKKQVMLQSCDKCWLMLIDTLMTVNRDQQVLMIDIDVMILWFMTFCDDWWILWLPT